MKRLDLNLEKERQCHITKQLVHYFESDVHRGEAEWDTNVLGLTNPDVNHNRMHQLYRVTNEMFMTNRPLVFLFIEPKVKCSINPLYNNGFEQKVMYCYISEPPVTKDGDSFEHSRET